MKRKISLFACTLLTAFALSLLAFCADDVITPDSHGTYTVDFKADTAGDYLLFAIKGKYDQTNYIEAYNGAKDNDIVYFEQKTSDKDGNVTFGPFVPGTYCDATLIVGNSSFDEPYLAGYLSAKNIKNDADIEISGIENTYTVSGKDGKDITVDLKVTVLDSFGYPSNYDGKVELSLSDDVMEGVELYGNELVISSTAKEQVFFVSASTENAYTRRVVAIKRESEKASYISVYSDSACKNEVSEVNVVGTAGNYPSVTLYAKTFNQYREQIDDEYTYVFNGKTAVSTVTPQVSGKNVFTVKSKKYSLENSVDIVASARPNYANSTLELYNLIAECEEEYALLGKDKFVSLESGKDVYPAYKWTSSEKAASFEEAIKDAKSALSLYGTDGHSDGDYASEVSSLSSAKNAYVKSFSSGKRVDAKTIVINEQDLSLPVSVEKTQLTVTTTPTFNQTTEKLTWTSSNPSVASVDANGNVSALSAGTVTVTATTRSGLFATTKITVYTTIIRINVSPSSLTATYGAKEAVFTADVEPKNQTEGVVWSIKDESLAELSVSEAGLSCTILPKKSGKTTVTVSTPDKRKSKSAELIVVMPDWETVGKATASVESGSVLKGKTVSLSSETENAKIYYTLDGTTPSKTNGRLYTKAICLSTSLTLRAVAVCDGMYDSEIASYTYRVIDSVASISNVLEKPKNTAKTALSFKDYDNIKTASVKFTYDESIVKSVNVLPTNVDGAVFDSTVQNGVVTVSVTCSKEGVSLDSTPVTLEFVISDDADEGIYDLKITESTVELYDGTKYSAERIDGKLTVKNYLIGDADGNGKIGLSDVLVIKKYLAGDESVGESIIMSAADVNRDGKVDEEDLSLLSKYCVGWNVTLG